MTIRLLTSTLLLSGAALLAGCATSPPPSEAAAAPAPTYADTEPLGAAMEGWVYPYPVQMLQFEHEGRLLRMAYMDVQPAQPNGKTVVLFHGKNFGAEYWANTLRALSAQGYRVIAPDQIGFGKSAKPEIRYTFAMLADNTVLEDYVPSIPPQQTANLLKLEMAQTTTSYRAFIKSYFKDNYRPEFERFVEQFARMQRSAEYPRVAHVSALTYQMIYEGPTYHELPKLTVPTLLAIGQLDRTVFGRRFAPPEAVKNLGYFPQLGKDSQKRIPGAQLVEFDNVGHVPHLEAPERFHAAVLAFLADKR